MFPVSLVWKDAVMDPEPSFVSVEHEKAVCRQLARPWLFLTSLDMFEVHAMLVMIYNIISESHVCTGQR